MSNSHNLAFKHFLKTHRQEIGKIVDFNPAEDKLLEFDFTENNSLINAEIVGDTNLFSHWVDQQLQKQNCRYGIGGYNEYRTLYSRSDHFDDEKEPRRLHLGIDIWGPARTAVYNPIRGSVHSFKFNDHFGDYGATIILKHQFPGLVFYTLYGHLNLDSLSDLHPGMIIPKGQKFAEFGLPAENGGWPPHLHFQLISDLKGNHGDFPGVCRLSEKAEYLLNCPDPSEVLTVTFQQTRKLFV